MILKCCVGAAALYLLSRITGRDADILKSVIRVHQLKDLAELIDSCKASPLIIAVTGNVASETPIKCERSGSLAVFVEETVEQHFLKRNWKFSWVQDNAMMKPITKQVPWHLDDGTSRVNIVGAQGAIGFTLTVGNEVFEKSETSSLVRRTLDFLQGLKMLGVRRMERVLPIGTHLTVVGEAVKESIGDFRIQEPERGPFYVSPIPLDQLISKLGKWSRWFKYASMGLTFAGLVLISKPLIEYILVRVRYTLERRRQQQQQQHQERQRQQQRQQHQEQQRQQHRERQRQQHQERQQQQHQEQQRQREQQQQQQQREQQQQRHQERHQERQQQQDQERQQQQDHERQQQQEQEQPQHQEQQRSMRRDLDPATATQRTEPVSRGSKRQHESSSDGPSKYGRVSDLCMICFEQKYDTAFVKCGHMCCCKTCSFKLQKKKCPICGTQRH